jgi:hypothetical protein
VSLSGLPFLGGGIALADFGPAIRKLRACAVQFFPFLVSCSPHARSGNSRAARHARSEKNFTTDHTDHTDEKQRHPSV